MSNINDFVIENGSLKKYTGTEAEVVIPEGVKYISGGVFANCTTIESVYIPDGVRSIYYRAFKNCTNLKSVRLPADIFSVEHDAFDGCANLADENGFVIINNTLYTYFGDAEVVTIPEGVTEIGDGVFCAKYGVKEIFLPESLKKIGYYTFGEMNGITIRIPKTVRPNLFDEDTFKERDYDEYAAHFSGVRKSVPYVLDFSYEDGSHAVYVIVRLNNDYTSFNSSFSTYTTADGVNFAQYDEDVIDGKRFKAPDKLYASLLRMTYPKDMNEYVCGWYTEFLQKNAKKAVAFACETDNDTFIKTLIGIDAINAKNAKVLKKQIEEAGAAKCLAAIEEI